MDIKLKACDYEIGVITLLRISLTLSKLLLFLNSAIPGIFEFLVEDRFLKNWLSLLERLNLITEGVTLEKS